MSNKAISVWSKNGLKETVLYPSTGEIVERTYSVPFGLIPEDVVQLRKGTVGKVQFTSVENMEVQLYRHHFKC